LTALLYETVLYNILYLCLPNCPLPDRSAELRIVKEATVQFMCSLAVAGDADADADGAAAVDMPAAQPALRRMPTAQSIAYGDVYVGIFNVVSSLFTFSP
jgi:hypothetical protein